MEIKLNQSKLIVLIGATLLFMPACEGINKQIEAEVEFATTTVKEAAHKGVTDGVRSQVNAATRTTQRRIRDAIDRRDALQDCEKVCEAFSTLQPFMQDTLPALLAFNQIANPSEHSEFTQIREDIRLETEILLDIVEECGCESSR